MRPPLVRLLTGLFLLSAHAVPAQVPIEGLVKGAVRSKSTNRPLQYANVVLFAQTDSAQVRRVTTDKDGQFAFPGVPPGRYALESSYIGYRSFHSPGFAIDPKNQTKDFKFISLTESAFAVDEVVVTSEKNIFKYAVDRKVYNIDRDMMSKSGTAGELLQNIPSVQVDMDGNVSLRGSSDVMILINGKQSPLMGRSRADVLQQMPAGSIEKIEVITNPSARFTPEGTSGIINIVQRKGSNGGLNANATVHAGFSGRHNESVDFNYSRKNLNIFGSYSYRHDLRTRTLTDRRWQSTGSSDPWTSYSEDSKTTMHPRAHIANLGGVYHPGEHTSLELSGDYFVRRPEREGNSAIVTLDSILAVPQSFYRHQSGYEYESEAGVSAAFQRDFEKEGHELRMEMSGSNAPETEKASFGDTYSGSSALFRSGTVLRQNQKQRRFSLDYAKPLSDETKLETGYAADLTLEDVDSYADSLDQSLQQFVVDAGKTYQFRADQTVHALYGTLNLSFGRVAVLGGLRGEYAAVRSRLNSGNQVTDSHYSGLYPTLHLTFKLSENRELQLNYSRRINRPEVDELNPFPEFRDPHNLEAGNPRLKPENIHSVELGYQWRERAFSVVPSIYYRYKFDGFTRVTEDLGDGTFLRTMKNLSSDQSVGFEPVVTLSLGTSLTANLNGNIFYDQIDASNIGYSDKKSVVSWSGVMNVNVNATRTTMLQINANYRSARLTPQGEIHPSFVLNAGVKQDFLDDKISLTLTASDLFKTQRQDVNLDINGTHQRVANRRDAQVAYLGLAYHYGRPEKKPKEKSLQYEDAQ